MIRQHNETIENYRKRRAKHQSALKRKLQGKLIWNNGQLIKDKPKKRISYTMVLRNKRGYASYLSKKFNRNS